MASAMALVVTVLVWLGDARNRTALRGSKNAGTAIESSESAEIPQGERFFPSVQAKGITHSLLLNMFFGLLSVLLLVATIYLAVHHGVLPPATSSPAAAPTSQPPVGQGSFMDWLSLALAIVSLLVAALAAFYAYRANHISVRQRLLDRCGEINEAFLDHEVRSPYAQKLGIPAEQDAEFSAKAVLLLHQINLLRDVYDNRVILGRASMRGYESWVRSIVSPWVMADAQLKLVWTLFHDSGDMAGRDFLDWLKPLMEPAQP